MIFLNFVMNIKFKLNNLDNNLKIIKIQNEKIEILNVFMDDGNGYSLNFPKCSSKKAKCS